MEQLTDKTIGEIVAEDYRTAIIFEKYGVDFCCNGRRSIPEICAEKDINAKSLLDQIQGIKSEAHSDLPDFKSWPLDLLIDYIEKKHHRYVEEQTPLLKQYLKKISEVHGIKHPELRQIAELFEKSSGQLAAHMKKEEFILFPYIRKMVKAQHRSEQPEQPQFGTVEAPIQMMMKEHENEGERFREINQLSNNYCPPEDACNTYLVAFALLKEFEDDLHLHIHLENNILFPKASKMEEQFNL